MLHKRAKDGKVKHSGYNFVNYDYMAPSGVTMDDLKSHTFWVDIAKYLRSGDEVKVLCDDMSFMARLLVIQSEANVGVRMHVLEHYDLNKQEEALPSASDGYEIKFRGPRKWGILRLKDNVMVAEDLDTREDAQRQLASHIKAMAA